MAYTTSEIGLLARLYPEKARARIVEAFRRGGTYDAAAAALECSKRNLHRLVVELGIGDGVRAHLTHVDKSPHK